MIQTSKVKALLNKQGLRVQPQALKSIDRWLEEYLTELSKDISGDGVKTVTPDVVGIYNGVQPEPREEKKCTKCANLKPEFIKLARSIQVYTHDEAVRLSKLVH